MKKFIQFTRTVESIVETFLKKFEKKKIKNKMNKIEKFLLQFQLDEKRYQNQVNTYLPIKYHLKLLRKEGKKALCY